MVDREPLFEWAPGVEIVDSDEEGAYNDDESNNQEDIHEQEQNIDNNEQQQIVVTEDEDESSNEMSDDAHDTDSEYFGQGDEINHKHDERENDVLQN